MKIFFVVLSAVLSLQSFAGPSISGGVPEAPWVESQDVLGQALQFVMDHSLPVESMQIANKNGEKVVAVKVFCPRKTTLIFKILYGVQEGSLIPIPTRVLELDLDSSGSCE